MQRSIIRPGNVRGLGDVISPKSASDYGYHNMYVYNQTDTVNGVSTSVYHSGYRSGDDLSLEYDNFVLYYEGLSVFTVRATLKYNNRPNVGKTLTCTVNDDTVYTGNTNSRGQVVFNIPVTDTGLYSFHVKYNRNDNNNYYGAERVGHVLVGEMDSLVLMSNGTVVQEDEKVFFVAEATCNTSEGQYPVPFQLVNFYEEYELYMLRWLSADIVQSGSVLEMKVKLVDEDGSGIPNQTIYFYEEYEAGALTWNNMSDIIESGDVLTVSAKLTDIDGSGVTGETVSFYELYTAGSVHLKTSTSLMQGGDTATLTASLHDADGSRIQVAGNTIYFYEEYDLSDVNVSASETVFETDDVVTLQAIVSDEDGSRIPNQTVYFYEEYDYSSLELSASDAVFEADDVTVLSAVLSDSDGSRVRDELVDFSLDFDSTEWSMTLNTNKSVVSVDETAVISAVVKDDSDTVQANVRVRFYVDE